MREIPFFSSKSLNRLDQYQRFFHTKSYIQKQSALLKTTQDFMRTVGYGNLQKFIEHRKQWDNMKRNIPLKYLDAIKVDLNIIQSCVQKDVKEFEAALQPPLFPKSAVIRVFAAIYSTKKFPHGTSENDAVKIMKEFSEKNHLRCCVNFPELKSIWIEPTGEVYTTYYKPVIQFTKFWMLIFGDGTGIGKSYIK